MSGQAASRCWVPIPAWSLAVRWCADAESELDALETAALGLLRNGDRTIDDLAELLGVGDDVVLSALLELADRGLVTQPESTAERWRAERGVESEGADLRAGRAFVTLHNGVVAARELDEGRKVASSQGSEDDVFDDALISAVRIDCPSLGEVQAALTRAVARGVLSYRGRDRGASSEPQRVSLVRLESLDAKGERNGLRRTNVWSAVDILPGLGGDAARVFHEPQLTPHEDADTPVSPALADWVHRNAPEIVRELDRRVQALAIDGSLVLRTANLRSLEELNAEMQRSRAELAERLGISLPASWPGALGEAGTRIDEASRWLVLARREPRYRDALRRCHAAAVEALAQTLWRSVRDGLREWADGWRIRIKQGEFRKREKRERYSEEAAIRRLRELSLADRLGPSLTHLLKSTEGVSETLRAIDRDEPGAGEAVTLWLLPLTLLDLEAARPHAESILRALEGHPHVFDGLDRLIDARNVIVHGRSAPDASLANQPDEFEASLLRIAAALARG